MSTVPHVITQYDDDEAAEVALVVSTTHTNTQKEKRLVQMSLSSMLVRRYGSGGNFRRGYRNVVVKGHFRSNGSYVKENSIFCWYELYGVPAFAGSRLQQNQTFLFRFHVGFSTTAMYDM